MNIDQALKKYLPKDNLPVSRAMRYSSLAGGKRFRGNLMLEVAKILGKDPKIVMPAACAVEMMHTFTLIHDDLPAMDDSDTRRGQPSCHKKFGEDMAILTGDALSILAFEILAKEIDGKVLPSVAWELAHGLGIQGVVGGQVLDLLAEGRDISLEQLKTIHRRKTGALIRAAVRMAAIICQASPKQLAALTKYAECLGLAFQIADDLLDVSSSSQDIGKPAGADRKNKKATYPSILGVEKSRALARQKVNEAQKALKVFSESESIFRLHEIANYAIERRK